MQFIKVEGKEVVVSTQHAMAAKSIAELHELDKNLNDLKSKIEKAFNDKQKTELNLKA